MRGNEPENKMRKTIIPIIIGLALISLASAMYAGECLPVNLSEMESLDNVVYDVIGNSSNLDGLTIYLNGTIANICTVPNYKPDSFTIIFIDNSTKTIVKEVPGECPSCSGGGSRTIYKDRNVTVEKIVYVNQTEETEEPIVLEEEKKPQLIWFYILCGAIFLAILFMWYRVVKREKNKKEKDKENKSE